MEATDVVGLFDELRVADVRDGMDWVGLHDKGTVAPEIGPLWRGARLCGVARTVQMRPTEQSVPTMPPEEYTTYAADWYANRWQLGLDKIEPGDVVVIDSSGLDIGNIGSNNSLKWHADGAVGVVTNGGVRDSDELVLQEVPIFYAYRAMKMPQGREEVAAVQVPVNIGGVLVRPGDIVVADGDGVVVVPIEHAADVAKYARQELDKDKAGRRALYERLGRPLDATVE